MSSVENLVKAICDRRKALLPTVEQNIHTLREMQQALLAVRSQVTGASSEIRDKLANIDFNGAELSLKNAVNFNELAVKRLRRKSINIGVAGCARQGKSQFLKMLTGLTDQQIPTGDTGFCTAARSIIHNVGANGASKATVYYLSEEELLNKKIKYAYVGSSVTDINLSPVPKNLDEFINTDLPKPSKNLVGLEAEQYGLLEELREALKKNPDLQRLIGQSPKEIDINDVRSYVTKDQGDVKYYVVDHVEIECPVPTLPNNSNVYDVSGLEDPQPGIQEAMVKSITEDADIVFLLRRPDPAGDAWKDIDHNIVGMLSRIYADANIDVSDWVQLVMNLDLRPTSNNQNVLAKMEQKPPKGLVPVRCNCGDADDVAAMVDNNMQRLASQCEKIDDVRIKDAQKAFAGVKELLKHSILEPLENGLADIVAAHGGFDFDNHFVDFMSKLRGPIRQNSQLDIENDIVNILKADFENTSNGIDLYYDGLAQVQPQMTPEHFPIFNRNYIEILCGAKTGPGGAFEDTVRNQREAIISELRFQLSGCCEKIIACYYDHVLQMFAVNNVLSGLFADVGGHGNACECIDLALKRLKAREGNEIPDIILAFEDLRRFSITFEGNILPAISEVKDFENLDPDNQSEDYKGVLDYISNSNLATQYDKQADFIFTWLKEVTENILSQITVTQAAKTTIQEIAHFIAAGARANFKTFGYHLVFGKNVEDQWKRFAKNNQAILWKKEFEEAAAKSAVAAQWVNVLAQLKKTLV